MATATKQAAKHNLKAGDLLISSWGYDQTNVDFYEVVGVSASMIRIRKRNSEIKPVLAPGGGSTMSGTISPADGFASEEVLSRRVNPLGGVKIESYAYAYAWDWDQKPKYCSWYA
jgi:hypothetical protein